jgi:hypothetical protein
MLTRYNTSYTARCTWCMSSTYVRKRYVADPFEAQDDGISYRGSCSLSTYYVVQVYYVRTKDFGISKIFRNLLLTPASDLGASPDCPRANIFYRSCRNIGSPSATMDPWIVVMSSTYCACTSS